MSGVAVIGELLRADTSLVALVPIARIKAGGLALDVQLPAIAVQSIGSSDYRTLAAASAQRINERVQVTVLASSYREQKAVLKLVRKACTYRRGDFGGVTQASVLADGMGPDGMANEAASIWQQSQDFLVSFNEI